MTKYAVVSPEFYDCYRLGDFSVPDPRFEYVEVEADTKTKAKVLAVRQWRAKGLIGGYRTYCESDQNPFTGLKAYDLDAFKAKSAEIERLLSRLCGALNAKADQ